MGLSNIVIFNEDGRILISRDYRQNVSKDRIREFIVRAIETDSDVLIPPIFHNKKEGLTFIHIKSESLYFGAVTKKNANSSTQVEFLYKLVDIFTEYFGEITAETIKDNVVTIIEILDEAMDYGVPQFTEGSVLKEVIKTQKLKKRDEDTRGVGSNSANRITTAITGAISWREPNIKYQVNEVFVDLVESLKMTVDTNGRVISSEIIGTIELNTMLSGMPDVKLGLNDSLAIGSTKDKIMDLDDYKFHQCVKLGRFREDKSITFVPPDGKFLLMSYRITKPIKALFSVDSIVEVHQRSRVDYYVKVKSLFRDAIIAQNVLVRIPVAKNIDSPKFRTSIGSASYSPSNDAIEWKIRAFEGKTNHILKASVKLSSFSKNTDIKALKAKPITIDFTIMYKTISGLRIKYLKVSERSGYSVSSYVKYMSKATDGNYSVRF